MAGTTSRALVLLSLLQTHRQWSGPELAARMDVTERTLRRDVERLRELGYRVAATRGVAGGYRLEAGTDLPPLLLDADEAVTVAIGLRAAATQGLVDGEVTTLSALAKFEQVLPPALRARVNALAASVSTRPVGAPPVSSGDLGQLALVCRDHDRIRFHYVAGSGEETDRSVEPHSLVSSERNWFLVGWDLHRQAWRTFRVDRISRIFNTRVRFPARELPAEDAAEYVASTASALAKVHAATVIIDLPLDRVLSAFGRWAGDATADGPGRTRWPISGRSHEEMFDSLVWVPRGVSYRIEADAEFLRFVRDASTRMLAAIGAGA